METRGWVGMLWEGFGLGGWWDRNMAVLKDWEYGVGVLAGCIRGDVVVFRFSRLVTGLEVGV